MKKSEIAAETQTKMEQKVNALKASSRVISILMKIGYTVMLVALCITVVAILFLLFSGGKTSFALPNGTNIILADGLPSSMDNLPVFFTVWMVRVAFLFAIFFLTYRMFHEISVTGDPFITKYVTTIRAIGILVASMTIAVGLAGTIMELITGENIAGKIAETPGVVFGIIIFCLSYIIDYGCTMKDRSGAEIESMNGAKK